MISKKLGIAIIGCAIGLGGIGGAGVYLTSLDKPAVELKQVEKMSEEKQQAFLDELLMEVSQGGKPSDVEKILGDKLTGLSKDNASEAVYLLMSSLAVEQEKQMESYRTVGEEILAAYSDKQFESGRNKGYGKVEDQSVKGYLAELERQHLYIQDDGQGLYLSQDLEYIQKAYEPYVNEALSGVIETRIQNQSNPYVNGAQTSYDQKLMLERILFIEGKKEQWKGTIYEGEMLALQEGAYMDFFGVTHDTYFEVVDGKMKMKQAVIDKMYELQVEYSNSFLGKDILGFMNELEADGFAKKDSQHYVYDQMMERFAVESSEQTPLILNQSGGDAE